MTNFIFYVNPTRALVSLESRVSAPYTLNDVACLTGVHPELLRYYCRLGLLDEHREGPEDWPAFAEGALHEVRRIEHYRRSLGIGRRALPLICELRRDGERLDVELRFLRTPPEQ
jgi:DNA-binding transcriptional MerR regulator